MESKVRKSEETKNRIINSAQKLFKKKGFEATSVREIVEDAGCAKGTFYLYFETKMDLLSYAINQVADTFNEIISAEFSVISDDPFIQIDRLLEALCLRMKEGEGQLKLLHTHEMLDLMMEQNIGGSVFQSFIGKISIFIKAGIEKGHFRPVNPELYAKIICSVSHELLETAMMHKYPGDLDTVTKELRIIFRKMLEK